MKLKTLKIHNIASIEDAIIDFSGSALGNQDIFLICGPTGAGKSTILDSICLALFNKTPRIENSANDSIDILADDTTKQKEKVKDVLHLVRRNAVEAWISLTFECSDGLVYTADWKAFRIGQYRNTKKRVVVDGEEKEIIDRSESSTFSKKSLSEKLKHEFKREWTLTDEEGVVTTTGVAAKIEEVVKMNFDQFCKTTMLAQGDFTRFLSSSSDHKAQILEKLVGTEKYAEVGKVINKTANEKRNEVSLLENEMNKTKFFSLEEIEEFNNQIEALSKELDELDKEKNSIDSKIKWITESQKVHKDILLATDAVAKADEDLMAEDVKRHSIIVDLWLKTFDVRSFIKVQNECSDNIRICESDRLCLEKEYVKAVGGFNALKDKIKKISEEINIDNETILQQKPYEDMFAHVSVICKAHDDLVDNLKFVSDNEQKLSAFDDKIHKLEIGLVAQQKAKIEAEKEIETAEGKLAELQSELQTHKVDTLDTEVNNLNAHKMCVNQAENALQAWCVAKDEYAVKLKALKEAEEKQMSLAEIANNASIKLSKSEEIYKARKSEYERKEAAIKEHAKVLRAQLKIGDNCPVCGNRVDEVLADEFFVNMLKDLEVEFRRSEDLYNVCTKASVKAIADANAGLRTVKTSKSDTDNANVKLEKSYHKLKGICDTLNIECSENIGSILELLKQQDATIETELNKRQQIVREIRAQHLNLTNQITAIRKDKLAIAVAAIQSVGNEISEQKAEKQNLNGRIDAARATIQLKRQEIDSITNPDWKPLSQESYYDDLKVAAKSYEALKSNLANKQLTAEKYQRDCSLISDYKNKILTLFAGWVKYDNLPGRDVDKLTSVWADLQSSLSVLAYNIESVVAKKKQADAFVADFFDLHNDIDINVVKSLMTHTSSDIEKMQNRLSTLNDAKIRAKAALESAQNQLNELPTNPLSEGESAESLAERLSSINSQVISNSQEIGRIKNELEIDNKNHDAYGEKKKKLDELTTVYQEWKMLDTYLGSTDGKNFRNVAQSFILDDLLAKANSYLENITGRYTLFCNPGTLTIMMRDAYQGGVIRPTNTLSGGESFIISLALALGLSSMQSTGFEVDTLFIDEGFGTLSPEFIDPVINSLKNLYQQYGRRVGIISHVDTLKARIPVTIDVTREGNSSSKVKIVVN